jgi:hypothetical protein
MACQRLVVQGANQQGARRDGGARNHHAHHRPSSQILLRVGGPTRGSLGCQGPRDDGWGGVPAEAACLTFNTDHSII